MNLPIPLCILEFDGNISWYNNKFYDMTESPDLLGENIDNIIKNHNLWGCGYEKRKNNMQIKRKL